MGATSAVQQLTMRHEGTRHWSKTEGNGLQWISKKLMGATLIVLLGGCFTIETSRVDAIEGVPCIYSGTAYEILSLSHEFDVSNEFLSLGIVFSLVDVPLSLVADTAILPFTIVKQTRKPQVVALHAAAREGDLDHLTDLVEHHPALVNSTYVVPTWWIGDFDVLKRPLDNAANEEIADYLRSHGARTH